MDALLMVLWGVGCLFTLLPFMVLVLAGALLAESIRVDSDSDRR